MFNGKLPKVSDLIHNIYSKDSITKRKAKEDICGRLQNLQFFVASNKQIFVRSADLCLFLFNSQTPSDFYTEKGFLQLRNSEDAIYITEFFHWFFALGHKTLTTKEISLVSYGRQNFFPSSSNHFTLQEDIMYFENLHSFSADYINPEETSDKIKRLFQKAIIVEEDLALALSNTV
jgi:hypothetical protein